MSAVSDHGDRVALLLQLRDHVQLVLGKQGGVDLVDPGRLPDGLGHQPGVTGEHDHLLHAGPVQAGDHLGCILSDLIGDGDDADHLVIDRHDHRRLALGGQRFRRLGGAAVIDNAVLE